MYWILNWSPFGLYFTGSSLKVKIFHFISYIFKFVLILLLYHFQGNSLTEGIVFLKYLKLIGTIFNHHNDLIHLASTYTPVRSHDIKDSIQNSRCIQMLEISYWQWGFTLLMLCNIVGMMLPCDGIIDQSFTHPQSFLWLNRIMGWISSIPWGWIQE